MADKDRLALFTGKYKDGEKIWCGDTILGFPGLAGLLEELPVSPSAAPTRDYSRTFEGGAGFIYGEILACMTGFEGWCRDRYYKKKDCSIKPVFTPAATILVFAVDYVMPQKGEATFQSEVIRTGERNYLWFMDYYRPY
jgi:hypothetical protein